jgi:predicted dehydrogenase
VAGGDFFRRCGIGPAEELRFGIVGTGTMARHHAAALTAYHRSSVTAWAARSAEAEDLDRFGPARVYTDAEQLAADPEVDAIVVATPDFAHAEPALAALEAGKHLLVEKPLATRTDDAESILAAARRAGVKVMTIYNHRWVPAYWQAKERITADALGEPVLAYARKNDTIDVPTRMLSWASETSPAWFLSSHDIDLVCWYFESEPVEVFATAVHKVLRGLGIDTPDAIQAQVRFANGAVATFEACWTYPSTFPTMTDSFIGLILTDGVIHLDRKREQIEIASRDRFEYPRNLLINQVGGRPSGSVYAAVCHFVDAVLDGKEPLVTLESSVRVTHVLEAIHRSCERGAAVHIEEEEIDDKLRV